LGADRLLQQNPAMNYHPAELIKQKGHASPVFMLSKNSHSPAAQ
jgi:hypothetical protein